MKNNIMVTVLTMVLTLALVLAGCSKKDAGGGSGTKALVGTWEGAYGLTWSFTGNKFTQSMGGVKQTVPYKIKGNSISTKYQDFEVEWDFEIDGDTLTIEVMGFPIEFKRVKNSGSGSVTYIGPETFPYSKLTSVTIPNSVTTIGRLAFYDYQLTSITIGRNVKTIGASAFYNNKLTSVTIPDSVTTIGWGAFYNNFGLTRVTIGANVDVSADPFPGNLAQVYTQGGRAAGTYKSSDGGTTWTNASGGGGMAVESGNSKQPAKAATQGQSWTTLSAEKTGFLKLEEARDIYGVAYGNGKCVAIGDSQIMSISTDGGKTWQAKTVKPPEWSGTQYDPAVLYGNGFFVITSSDGVYFASEDNLEDWEKVESPVRSSFNSGDWLFGDGVFCVVEKYGDEVFFADTPRGPWKKGATLPEEFGPIDHGIYADGKFVLDSFSGIAFTDSPSNKWTYLDAEVIGLSRGFGHGIAYAAAICSFFVLHFLV